MKSKQIGKQSERSGANLNVPIDGVKQRAPDLPQLFLDVPRRATADITSTAVIRAIKIVVEPLWRVMARTQFVPTSWT